MLWCLRQAFTAEESKNIVLTWKGKQLFDVTSCKSLGIGVDLAGNISSRGQKIIFTDRIWQVHFQAVTQETLENLTRAEERGEREQDVQNVMPEPQKDGSKDGSKGLRIILKA
jgi:hypothetical protein